MYSFDIRLENVCYFGGAKVPVAPAPPTPPPDSGQAAANVNLKNQAKYRQGRQSTILTDPASAGGYNPGQKKILGG